MKYIATGLMGLAYLLSVVATAQAEPITIENAGFEAAGLANGAINSLTGCGNVVADTPIPGWTVGSEVGGPRDTCVGSFNPAVGHFPNGASEGEIVAWSEVKSISQVLSSTLAFNTAYTLNVDVGVRLDISSPGYNIQLLAGTEVLAEDRNSVGLLAGEFVPVTVT